MNGGPTPCEAAHGGSQVRSFARVTLRCSLLSSAMAAALFIAGCSQQGAEQRAATTAVPAAALPDTTSAARVRLMTANQYANVIADVFGADIKPGKPLGPLTRTDGL